MKLVLSIAILLLSISSGITFRTTRIQKYPCANGVFRTCLFSPSPEVDLTDLCLVRNSNSASKFTTSLDVISSLSPSFSSIRDILVAVSPVFASSLLLPKIAYALPNYKMLSSFLQNKKSVVVALGIFLCGGLIASFFLNLYLNKDSRHEVIHIRKRSKLEKISHHDDNETNLADIGRFSRNSGRISRSEICEVHDDVKIESTVTDEPIPPPNLLTSSLPKQQAGLSSPSFSSERRSSSGGLLSRWFGSRQQGGNGFNRSNTLSSALLLGKISADSNDEKELRQLLLFKILRHLPENIVDDILKQDKIAFQHIKQELQICKNIDQQEDFNEFGSHEDVAKIFADVANAVVVHAIDNAILRLENLPSPEITSNAIKELFQVMEVTGLVFKDVAEGVSNLAPLIYNGKMKKMQLETLYSSALGVRLQNDIFDAADLNSERYKHNDEKDESSSTDYFDQYLARLQFLCNIKGSRRDQLEQKSFMTLLMSQNSPKNDLAEFPNITELKSSADPFAALSGIGDLGNLKNLEGLLNNNDIDLSALGNIESLAEAENLLKSMDSVEQQKLFEEVLKNVNSIPGFPDLSKMRPEEIETLTKEAMKNFNR